MKMFIQSGHLDGIFREIKRKVKSEREYTIEIKETKRSINKRKKLRNENRRKNDTQRN